MCDNCTKAYWKHMNEYNKALVGRSADESRAKKEHKEAVENCEDRIPVTDGVRRYWNE